VELLRHWSAAEKKVTSVMSGLTGLAGELVADYVVSSPLNISTLLSGYDTWNTAQPLVWL